MSELLLELKLYSGETYDNTIELDKIDFQSIEKEILSYADSYHQEGYEYCDKRYYHLNEVGYESLLSGKKLILNGCMLVQLYYGDD